MKLTGRLLLIAMLFALPDQQLFSQQGGLRIYLPATPQESKIFQRSILRMTESASKSALAVSSAEPTIVVLDPKTLQPVATLKTLTPPTTLEFTPDGTSLLAGFSDGSIVRYETQNWSPAKPFAVHKMNVRVIRSSLDSKSLFTFSDDKTLKHVNILQGNTIASATINVEVADIIPMTGAPGLALVTTAGSFNRFEVPALRVAPPLASEGVITAFVYSPDRQFIIAGYDDGSIAMINPTTLRRVTTKQVHSGRILSINIEPNQRWIATTGVDSAIVLSAMGEFSQLWSSKHPNGFYTYAALSSDASVIAFDSRGSAFRWEISMTPPDLEKPGFVITSPLARTGAAMPILFSETIEVQGIAYDNMAITTATVNGQPLVLQPAAGVTDPSIPAGKRTYTFTARVKMDSAGINTFHFSASDEAQNIGMASFSAKRLKLDEVVEILSPTPNMETDNISVPLKFVVHDQLVNYSLKRNLITLFEGKMRMNFKPGDVVEDELSLVGGYNQIQLTIQTRNAGRITKNLGVSRKITTQIASGIAPTSRTTSRSPIQRTGPQRFAVVVGISEYQSAKISPLKYADKDAKAFAEFLTRPEGGMFPKENIMLLTNKDATLQNVQHGLVNFLKSAIDSDLVVIYFAGHGLPEPDRPDNLFLLTHDADPKFLATTAFPMWQLKDYLGRYISSKRIVVFTDACHSGGITTDFATRGLAAEQNPINQYLMDLSASKFGTVVFAASAAGEVSQELHEFGHGVFTYYLLQGLGGLADLNNDYTVTIGELMAWVEEQVKRKTKGAQTPTRSQTTYDKDLPMSWKKF